MSDGLDQALSEINDAVATVDGKAWLYPTKHIRKYVVQLYTQIFHFLTEAMDWYTKNRRHRVRLSFNQNLYSDLILKLSRIKETARLISDEIQGGQSAELRALRLQHEQDMETIRMYLFADAQEKLEIKNMMEKLEDSLHHVAEAKSRMLLQDKKDKLLLQIWERLQIVGQTFDERVQTETLARPARRILGGIAREHVQVEASESHISHKGNILCSMHCSRGTQEADLNRQARLRDRTHSESRARQ